MEKPPLILVVDDNPRDITLFQAALENCRITWPLQVATHAQNAIAYLRGDPPYTNRDIHPLPAIVFTDLNMPGGHGFELLAWLRDNSQFRSMPVIVWTTSRMESDIHRAYELGAHSYMVKPVNFGQLEHMMRLTFQYWDVCEKPR
ncbi:MAG: response regulator [Verrucomicrobia subdivision 3 bacterium]|nr:response regulator [Limisphaerales bacterium]